MEASVKETSTKKLPDLVVLKVTDKARGRTKLKRTEAMTSIKDAIEDINQTASDCINERSHAKIIERLLTVLNTMSKVLHKNLTYLESVDNLGNESAVASKKDQVTTANQSLTKKPSKYTKKEMVNQAGDQQIEKKKLVTLQQTVQETKPAPTENSNPWVAVVKKGLLGSRKDKLVMNQQIQEDQLTDTVEMGSQEDIKQLTREPRPPQEHQVVVVRYNNVASRKDVPVKVWREKLRQHQIRVHSIVFPSWGSIEIVASKEEELKIRKFFKSINRTPEDTACPFSQKATQGRMTPEIASAICRSRIQMMMHEKSIIALRYLKECVVYGMTLVDEKTKKTLQIELEKAQRTLRI